MAIHDSYPSDSTSRIFRPALSEEGTWVTPIGELYEDQALEAEIEPKNPFFTYVDAYSQDVKNGYNVHISWALRVLARTAEQLATAETAEQATRIQQEFNATEASNKELFAKAEAFIAKQKADAENALLNQMQAALAAYDTGDKAAYAEIERTLHDTNPIDTADIRARIAADRAAND